MRYQIPQSLIAPYAIAVVIGTTCWQFRTKLGAEDGCGAVADLNTVRKFELVIINLKKAVMAVINDKML